MKCLQRARKYARGEEQGPCLQVPLVLCEEGEKNNTEHIIRLLYVTRAKCMVWEASVIDI